MQPDVLKRKQAALREYLYDMALSCMDESQLRQMLTKLKSIYSNDFRHSYSEFFPMIVEISKDNNSYDLDFLSNNLEALREMVLKSFIEGESESNALYQSLDKLIDHINLEIARYSHYSMSEQKVNDLESKHRTLQSELKESTEALKSAQKKVSTVQTELIAVLSIFAAIVFTFSGSISIIGNALSGMGAAPFFKAVFFVLLCGFVVFNTIFLMMYIVGKVTGRNIYARCQSPDCTCDGGQPKCHGIVRIKKRLPYVFWMNAVFLILMAADLILWNLNAVFSFFPAA